MRNFRDAEAMAQSLREAMGARQISLTHSEALELVSTMLGFADWNTLSACINKDRGGTGEAKVPHTSDKVFPVIPMKDLVPFPAMQKILWVKRDKTVQAISKAFSRRRELVVVAQKSPTIEEPGVADIIASRRPLPLEKKQVLLATLDPVARLGSVLAHMAA